MNDTFWLENEIERLDGEIINHQREIERRLAKITWHERQLEIAEAQRDCYQHELDWVDDRALRSYTQWSQIGGYPS